MANTLAEIFETKEFFKGKPLAHDMGGEPSRVHDWRNYVPAELSAIWSSLSDETKMAVAIIADNQASKEVWD